MEPDGEQWSVGSRATTRPSPSASPTPSLDATSTDLGDFQADNLLIGASAGFDAWSVGSVYGNILNAEGEPRGARRRRLLGALGQYDLGGGAPINGGVRWTYDIIGLGDDEDGDQASIGDFGIKMAF